MAADEVLGDSIPELFTTLGEDPEKWTRQLSHMESHKPFREFDYSWLAPNGELNVFRISGKPIFDTQDKFAGYRGAARDITEAYRLSQELSYQASHDPLTGQINRRGFEHRLQQLLDSARKDQVEHALLYIDLDQFKLINDTCGHLAGDELLRQISEVLRHLVRRGDTLARVGGDEFGILLERCSLHEAMRIAHTVRKNVEEFRFVWDEHSFAIGVSIGLIAVTDSSESIDVVLKEADAACYAAKDEGRNRVHLYAQDDAALRKRRGEMRWISAIQQALDENRLLLCYQPIIPLHEDATDHVHYELLLRMQDEDGQVIPPGAFLPAAERYSLSTKLDRWVVGSALDWLQGQGEQLERLYSCSINLSGHSLGNEEFLRFVIDKLTQSQVAPEKICFEITEAAATANLVNAMKFINQMKEVGCQFALDDFGSGLSSFAYLKKLPVDFLKIDGLFVKNIASDSIDFSMVKSINEIGHVMGKKTVAEFVEDEEILAKLREIGVDFAQGYAIGRPQLIEQLPKLASHA
jgi:diguanylate cyclase (GGDEF)-like protein/PAS domain S-box-containing protein